MRRSLCYPHPQAQLENADVDKLLTYLLSVFDLTDFDFEFTSTMSRKFESLVGL